MSDFKVEDADVNLKWESAGTDEPGDQNASSRLGSHAHWSLGPGVNGWHVELVVRNDDLEEVTSAGVSLGVFHTEGEAKAAAGAVEARA